MITGGDGDGDGDSDGVNFIFFCPRDAGKNVESKNKYEIANG